MNDDELAVLSALGNPSDHATPSKVLDRHQQRWIKRQLNALIQRSPDNCSICKRPFSNGDTTRVGFTVDGEPALAGECCAARMKSRLAIGIYFSCAEA